MDSNARICHLVVTYWQGLLARPGTPQIEDMEQAEANSNDSIASKFVAAAVADISLEHAPQEAVTDIAFQMLWGLAGPVGALLLGSRGVSGSCFAADDLIARIPSYGGAGLIRKGPLREACRAMVSAGLAPRPCDYHIYAPPGPGAKYSLNVLRPRAATRPRNKEECDAGKAQLAKRLKSSSAVVASGFYQELRVVHDALDTAALSIASGQPWELHETQSALCSYSKWDKCRLWLLGGAIPGRLRLYNSKSGNEHSVWW